MFSASTPDKQVNTYQQRLEDESYLAFLGMLALDLVKTKHVNRVPMLVLGAEDDAIVSQRQIRRTAAVYGAEAEIFPDLASYLPAVGVDAKIVVAMDGQVVTYDLTARRGTR